jgi:hypothetical protein
MTTGLALGAARLDEYLARVFGEPVTVLALRSLGAMPPTIPRASATARRSRSNAWWAVIRARSS